MECDQIRFIFHYSSLYPLSVLQCLDLIGQKSHQQQIWHHHMSFSSYPCVCMCVYINKYIYIYICVCVCVCICLFLLYPVTSFVCEYISTSFHCSFFISLRGLLTFCFLFLISSLSYFVFFSSCIFFMFIPFWDCLHHYCFKYHSS